MSTDLLSFEHPSVLLFSFVYKISNNCEIQKNDLSKLKFSENVFSIQCLLVEWLLSSDYVRSLPFLSLLCKQSVVFDQKMQKHIIMCSDYVFIIFVCYFMKIVRNRKKAYFSPRDTLTRSQYNFDSW